MNGPRPSTAARRPRVAYGSAAAFGTLAIIFATVTTVIAFEQISVNQDRTRAAVDAAFAERSTFTALEDEETGVRGYVATGDRRFLEPYALGRAAYVAHRREARGDEGPVGLAAARVDRAGDALQPFFTQLIAEVESGRRAHAIARLREGKTLFDALRRQDALAFAALRHAIDGARAATHRAIILAQAAIIATALALLLAGAIAAQLFRAARESASLARRDPLTALPNRRAFEEELDHALRARASDEKVTVLYLDLDRFKAINDEFGHGAGDDVLALCGERLRRALRPGDFVARIGGDEFAALLIGVRRTAVLDAVVARITAAVDAPFAVAGTTVHIGASVGWAVAPEDGVDAAAILGVADAAMYRAKRAARA